MKGMVAELLRHADNRIRAYALASHFRVAAFGAVVLVVAALGGSQPARATVLLEVPLDEMIKDSDAIVLGEVSWVDTRMVLGGERLELWTLSSIRVRRWLKAGAGPEQVTLHERGGHFRGQGMRIAGTPTYRVGESVLVFLKRDAAGRFRTYGLSQGRFLVRPSAAPGLPTVVRDFRGASLAQWVHGQLRMEEAPPQVVRLDEILTRVEQVLEVRP